MTVLGEADKVYLGEQEVDVVYVGEQEGYRKYGFAPSDLSGLTVWLDASQLTGADGSAVSPWPDLSGAGHHGLIFGSPPPTVRANALSGQRVVRFKVNEGRVRGGPIFGGGLEPYNLTVVYVARMVGPYYHGRIFTAAYPGANYLVGFHTSGYESMYDNGWVNSGVPWPPTPTPWKIYGSDGSHDGTTYLTRFLIDGVVSGTASTGSGMGTLGWNISGYSETGVEETCDCEVAELVIYNRKLSEVERQQVEGYLRGKWGL
jgi:hypothetical protein